MREREGRRCGEKGKEREIERERERGGGRRRRRRRRRRERERELTDVSEEISACSRLNLNRTVIAESHRRCFLSLLFVLLTKMTCELRQMAHRFFSFNFLPFLFKFSLSVQAFMISRFNLDILIPQSQDIKLNVSRL